MFPKPATKTFPYEFYEFDHQRHDMVGVEPLFDFCVCYVEKCVSVKA